MTWHNIANGYTSTASEINENFQHIVGYSYLPLAGTSMLVTTGAHNIGSARYRWNKIYCSGYIKANTGLALATSAEIQANGVPIRGFVHTNRYSRAGGDATYTTTSIIFSKVIKATINPTVSGYMTVTASVGIDTRQTTSSYIMNYVKTFRRMLSGTCCSTNDDLISYNITTSSDVTCEFRMDTFTSASTQTAYFYIEFHKRTDRM